MHVSPASEQFHITAASDLGIQNKLFWSTRGTPGNVALQADLIKTHIDSLLARTKVSKSTWSCCRLPPIRRPSRP
jgi:hypothetical protein